MSASEVNIFDERSRRIEIHELAHFLPHRCNVGFLACHFEVVYIHAEEQLFLAVHIETFPTGNRFEA